MHGTKVCIIWIAQYTGLSRDLSLKEAILRGEMEAGERFVVSQERSAATHLPLTVDIWWQVQRRQGWTQDQVQKGILGDGKLGQEHEFVPVLRRSHRR